jgi:hypothetical protein
MNTRDRHKSVLHSKYRRDSALFRQDGSVRLILINVKSKSMDIESANSKKDGAASESQHPHESKSMYSSTQ